MSELFYNKDGITVEKSTREDAEYIAKHMRQADVQEIFDSHHFSPEEAMDFTIKNTIFCLTVKVKGVPAIIFGINGDSVLSERGTIFMLGTDDIQKLRFRFVRHSRKFIDMMLEQYSYLYNFVSADNFLSVGWLKFLGAQIEDAKPYGMEQRPFHYFSFSRS